MSAEIDEGAADGPLPSSCDFLVFFVLEALAQDERVSTNDPCRIQSVTEEIDRESPRKRQSSNKKAITSFPSSRRVQA